MDARLVVLGSDHPYSKVRHGGDNTAKAMLDTRGTTPRRYRNSLVFLAADRTRLQDLDAAVRRLLAWESILAEREQLDLSPHQVKQADTQRANAEATVTAQLPETWQWLLVPGQSSPQSGVQWQAIRLSGAEPLAARAARKLRSDELLVTAYAPTRLRLDLDRVPFWRADPARPLDRNHVLLRQLAEYASYLYLPRLADPNVLAATVRDGLTLPNWETESFAFADSHEAGAGGSGAGGGNASGGWVAMPRPPDDGGEDDAAPVGRFVGLRTGQAVNLPDAQAPGLLVRPDAARRQLEAARRAAEVAAAAARTAASGGGATGGGNANETTDEQSHRGRSPDGDRVVPPVPPVAPCRCAGAATMARCSWTRIAPAWSWRASRKRSCRPPRPWWAPRWTLTLEIQANIPEGAPDQVVRTVTENGRAPVRGGSGFELERPGRPTEVCAAARVQQSMAALPARPRKTASRGTSGSDGPDHRDAPGHRDRPCPQRRPAEPKPEPVAPAAAPRPPVAAAAVCMAAPPPWRCLAALATWSLPPRLQDLRREWPAIIEQRHREPEAQRCGTHVALLEDLVARIAWSWRRRSSAHRARSSNSRRHRHEAGGWRQARHRPGSSRSAKTPALHLQRAGGNATRTRRRPRRRRRRQQQVAHRLYAAATPARRHPVRAAIGDGGCDGHRR